MRIKHQCVLHFDVVGFLFAAQPIRKLYKKIFGTVILLNLVLITTNAQNLNWAWAKSGNGIKNDGIAKIITDANGNTFAVGGFISPSITFGNITLHNSDQIAPDYSTDGFIVKYSPEGNVLWAKSAGVANASDNFLGICFDADGNVLITGVFDGNTIAFDSITLHGGPGVGGNIFITKYEPSGNVIWAKSIGGIPDIYHNCYQVGTAIASAINGNIFITGSFYGAKIVLGNDTLISTGGGLNGFVAKLDSAGNSVWGRKVPASDLCTDAQGNVILTGSFSDSIAIFGNDTLRLASQGNGPDVFIVKYNTNGDVVWAKSAGDLGAAGGGSSAICIDANDNTYITGQFRNQQIIFGNDTLTSASHATFDDAFVVKYDSSGNVMWAKSIADSSHHGGRAIDADTGGDIWITGYQNNDVFIAAYNTGGNLLWIDSIPSISSSDIKTDGNGNLFLAGTYGPTATFGSIVLTNADNTGSTGDVFVARFNYGITGIAENHNSIPINVYPNPFSNKLSFKVQDNEPTTVSLYNFLGQQIGLQTFTRHTTINTAPLSAGIYFYELRNANGLLETGKVIKQ